MGRPLTVLAACLAWTSWAQAQTSPVPPAAADPSARRHDGFYLRLGLGGGALDAEFSGGQPETPDAKADGGAVLLDILVGGTPVRGLVLGGGYHIAVATEPDFEVGTTYTGKGGAVGQGVVGPFVDFFPDDEGGFDVGMLAGMAIVSMNTPRIFGQGVELDHRGFGASGWAGYTLWLADQWSLGVGARVTWTTTVNTESSDQKGAALSYGAVMTAIYH